MPEDNSSSSTTPARSQRDSSQAPATGDTSISPPSAPSDFLKHLPPSTSVALEDEEESPQPDGQSGKPSAAPSKLQVDSHGRILNPRSCVTCRKRKVKCDKVHPCNNCTRAHIDCVFPSPGRAPRKARKLGDGRDKELLERLRRLEGVVKGMGVEVPTAEKDDGIGETHSVPGPDSSSRVGIADIQDTRGQDDHSRANCTYDGLDRANHEWFDKTTLEKSEFVDAQQAGRFENRFGRLVINEGRSRYINNSFWANLSNEVEDLKGILNQTSDDEDMDASPNSTLSSTGSHQGWAFGFSSQNVNMLSLHPQPGQIHVYWEIYKDRVDPLVKVLHIPTVEPTALSAASHLSNLSRGFEALLFAIYYGATTSLSTDECLLKFGETKAILLSRYRFAIEQALARANFLTTEEMVVLQAFVIFLICLRRNNDARVIWTLTGLVVRIAQTIGIHRDGSHFGLTPFEVEMRRRLWWQVCILDTRASEDHGCDPTIIEQAFDTEMPRNINDADISPDSKDFPPDRQGCTDMSFCLIRFEVANTFRRINYIPPGPPRRCADILTNVTLQDKEKWITECHKRLEDRYLAHCDMSVPIYWVTATVARLMMSKMWLMVYHPFQRHDGGASLSKETKEKLFITSLENMEYSLLLETEARTMKWGWLFKTYMQWHALAFILSELCTRTTGDLVDRAWVAVDKTRDGRWGLQIADDTRAGHLWRPLKKLYRKAKEARHRGLREEAIAKQLQPPLTPPKRTYSPNANPMFEHPSHPRITRAPLSQAQLHRLSNGPSFGQVPMDCHEWLKSPKLPETNGNDKDTGLMDVESGQASSDQHGRRFQDPNQSTGASGTSPTNTAGFEGMLSCVGPNAPHMFAPTAQPKQRAGPSFGQNFLNSTGSIDFSDTPVARTASSNNTEVPNLNVAPPAVRSNSIDSNGFDNGDVDMSSYMDTSGDLNWENWDQLVRQFGMEVDQVPTSRGGAPVDWGGGNWDMMPNGANGSNMRMGMGMGDWF